MKNKQNLTFFCLVILSICATSALYFLLNPDWILYKKAETKFRNKEFEAAIPFYLASLNAGLDYLPAMEHLANAYVATGNLMEAIVWYRKYLQKKPNDQKVRVSLAKALTWNGQLHEAESEYRKVLKKDNT